MIIGVDICNTIAQVNEALALHFLGTSKVPDDLQKQRQWNLPGLNPDFFRSPEGMNLLSQAKPYEKASEVLNSFIYKGHKIVYITARPQETELVSRRWLRQHNFPLGDIVHSHQKGESCLEKGVTFMIEDDPFYAEQVKRAGIPVFLVRQRYNVDFPAPKMDWKIAGFILPKAIPMMKRNERS
ncbi:hypothetical protein F9B85_00990 [Heliorestis acidaminivorans]|uniref:Nucleotidase n=1 Tax=Heliorestis acidaminivorans TaxID=553427 RepID=A0A6I0F2U4_9FIRM|nr:hypothetical protein [Heliorestis acidaminivorans]KAB2954301.1 hypothetical protein F9B85_00990 [Heliorestis acidaminivorans]